MFGRGHNVSTLLSVARARRTPSASELSNLGEDGGAGDHGERLQERSEVRRGPTADERGAEAWGHHSLVRPKDVLNKTEKVAHGSKHWQLFRNHAITKVVLLAARARNLKTQKVTAAFPPRPSFSSRPHRSQARPPPRRRRPCP